LGALPQAGEVGRRPEFDRGKKEGEEEDGEIGEGEEEVRDGIKFVQLTYIPTQ
jgi:hypothetical protein